MEWVLYFWGGGGGSLSQCVCLEQAQRGERRSSYWTRKTFQLFTVLWLFRWILIYIGLIRFGLVYRVSCLYWAITMPKEEVFYVYLHSCLNKPLDVIRSRPLCRHISLNTSPYLLHWNDWKMGIKTTCMQGDVVCWLFVHIVHCCFLMMHDLRSAMLPLQVTIPLMDIALECISTSSGIHHQQYVLTASQPAKAGTR